MKTILLIASLTTVCATAFAFPDYEPFSDATGAGGSSYTVGGNLAGQTHAGGSAFGVQSWWQYGPAIAGGGPATVQPTIAAGDLLVPGLYSAGGGRSAAFGGNGDSALMNLTLPSAGITAGTAYFSFAVKLTDTTSLNVGGAYFAGFNNLQSHNAGIGTPNSVGTRVMVRSATGGFNIGLQQGGNNNPSGFNTAWDDTVFTVADTLFLVGSYTFNAGAANDVANLWVNPDSSTFGSETSPTADLTSSGSATDLARAASFVILNRSANEPDAGLMDDLRIGQSWADVTPVPEPSTMVLGLLGVAGLLVARRHWKSA